MIKTTSFAPPRTSPTNSNPKARARQHAIKAAKTRAAAQAQPDLGSLFALPASAPEISASQARELIAGGALKTKAKTKTAPLPVASVASLPAPPIENTMPSTSPSSAPKKTPRTVKPKDSAPVASSVSAPVVVIAPVEIAPAEVVATIVEKTAPQKAVAGTKKPKKARVPVNLAEQYGQSLSKRVENGIEAVVEEDSPKKRMSRAERQARRELMNPDDDLMARLHRVHSAVPSAKPIKRPRGWRFDCGRCGQTSFFQTNGALCQCGALAIKE